jgi:hypothetical protein
MTPKTVRLPVMYSTAATSTPRSNRHAVKAVRSRPMIAVNTIGQIVGPFTLQLVFLSHEHSR